MLITYMSDEKSSAFQTRKGQIGSHLQAELLVQ